MESGSSWLLFYHHRAACHLSEKTKLWITFIPCQGRTILLCNCHLMLAWDNTVCPGMEWQLCPFPYCITVTSTTHHHKSNSLNLFMCDISWKEMTENAKPWPFKEMQPAFLPWSPVRILSQAPITLQSRPKPKPCSLTTQPIYLYSLWTCMQEALRASFPFRGVNYWLECLSIDIT